MGRDRELACCLPASLSSASSADPEKDGVDDEPHKRGPVRPYAPFVNGEVEADRFTEEEEDQEMRPRFGRGDADTQPSAEKGGKSEDGGADPDEERGRNFTHDVLAWEQMSQDGVAAKDDPINHDVTEHDRRDRSKQLHGSASFTRPDFWGGMQDNAFVADLKSKTPALRPNVRVT